MVSTLVYMPAAMAFWYAAPLIAWQDMGVFKAIFYSFFAVQRSGRAFLIYGLVWALLYTFIPGIVGTIIALASASESVVKMVLFALWTVLSVVMYCSFYPTYTHIFGRPSEPGQA
jgi:hypothetical protein